MKILITYEFLTAHGFPTQNTMIADSFEKAEEICEKVERIGYKLIDVTRDVYER